MKIRSLWILNTFCIMCAQNVYAQAIDIDAARQKKTFESTYWQPERGVTLLSDESARKTWTKYHADCSAAEKETPCLFSKDEDWGYLTSLVAFRTESLVVFVYTRFQLNSDTPNWLVYRSDTGELLYNAHALDAGYDYETSPPKGTEACSTTVHTSSRFRPYTKEGPLLLEAHVNVCQRDENHHEFLFHLDKTTLKEVDGSRMVMDHKFYIKDRPWTWWYEGEKYFRFGKLGWNKNGERTWTRQLVVSPLGDEFFGFQGSRFEQTCHYDKEKRAIQCKYEKTKNEEIPMKDGYSLRENNKPHWLKYETEFNTMGLSYSKELRSWLEDD